MRAAISQQAAGHFAEVSERFRDHFAGLCFAVIATDLGVQCVRGAVKASVGACKTADLFSALLIISIAGSYCGGFAVKTAVGTCYAAEMR